MIYNPNARSAVPITPPSSCVVIIPSFPLHTLNQRLLQHQLYNQVTIYSPIPFSNASSMVPSVMNATQSNPSPPTPLEQQDLSALPSARCSVLSQAFKTLPPPQQLCSITAEPPALISNSPYKDLRPGDPAYHVGIVTTSDPLMLSSKSRIPTIINGDLRLTCTTVVPMMCSFSSMPPLDTSVASPQLLKPEDLSRYLKGVGPNVKVQLYTPPTVPQSTGLLCGIPHEHQPFTNHSSNGVPIFLPGAPASSEPLVCTTWSNQQDQLSAQIPSYTESRPDITNGFDHSSCRTVIYPPIRSDDGAPAINVCRNETVSQGKQQRPPRNRNSSERKTFIYSNQDKSLASHDSYNPSVVFNLPVCATQQQPVVVDKHFGGPIRRQEDHIVCTNSNSRGATLHHISSTPLTSPTYRCLVKVPTIGCHPQVEFSHHSPLSNVTQLSVSIPSQEVNFSHLNTSSSIGWNPVSVNLRSLPTVTARSPVGAFVPHPDSAPSGYERHARAMGDKNVSELTSPLIVMVAQKTELDLEVGMDSAAKHDDSLLPEDIINDVFDLETMIVAKQQCHQQHHFATINPSDGILGETNCFDSDVEGELDHTDLIHHGADSSPLIATEYGNMFDTYSRQHVLPHSNAVTVVINSPSSSSPSPCSPHLNTTLVPPECSSYSSPS